jgi:hypothetical protein
MLSVTLSAVGTSRTWMRTSPVRISFCVAQNDGAAVEARWSATGAEAAGATIRSALDAVDAAFGEEARSLQATASRTVAAAIWLGRMMWSRRRLGGVLHWRRRSQG